MSRTRRLIALAGWVVSAHVAWPLAARAQDAPRSLDPRLVVEPFAAAPEIVHPIGMTFDNRGRLLVIESHTHFRPDGYQGPPSDRVRVLEDTDGDGRADRIRTLDEGTRFTMDLATYPDGAVYVATRNEIKRLEDVDGDARADKSRKVVFLETAGDYPHNGLSGLAFDAYGNLIFGLGENLGAPYSLRGSDGITISGGGEGGGIFTCSPDGRKLRRIATGFWNPFGICRDIFDRLFAIENDPDSMPPCRLLHVVEGGDYGYRFRYGRSGRHVFQAWNGELPGTLPMVSGTGEAPCEIVSYESDGLPDEYLGNLFVTAWADHRIERYVPKPRGASFTADQQILVRGGSDFRPVGLAVAPDGSLFVGDWVLHDYTLRGRGAIWHVRLKDSARPDRPSRDDTKRALLSHHRPLRDAAAARLADEAAGREFLRAQIDASDVRVRASSLSALIVANDRGTDLIAVAERDAEPGLRALAVRALAERGQDAKRFLDARYPAAVRLEAIGSLESKEDLPRLLSLFEDADSYLRSAAVRQVAQRLDALEPIDRRMLTDAHRRVGYLLACRASGRPEALRLLPEFLGDPDEDVRFLAVKWIADAKLGQFRPRVAGALRDQALNVRMASALATALARLDGQDVSEAKMADMFIDRLTDATSAPALKAQALKLVPVTHPRLTVSVLAKLIALGDRDLKLEAARALSEHPNPRRFPALLLITRDTAEDAAVRAQAIAGLAERSQEYRPDLFDFALGDDATFRDEALRALIGTEMAPAYRRLLEPLTQRDASTAALASRVLGKPFAEDRPALSALDAWRARLEGPADPEAGRRIFFQPKLAGCFRCHRVNGRGRDVGPDLSTIGRIERRRILESILQPSNDIGPSYQAWQLATSDGKVATGMLIHTNLDAYTYIDAKGSPFTLRTPEIVERSPQTTSIMPAGLAELFTDQELRDLTAYLGTRR